MHVAAVVIWCVMVLLVCGMSLAALVAGAPGWIMVFPLMFALMLRVRVTD